MGFSEFKMESRFKSAKKQDQLRIHHKKGIITAILQGVSYIDKETDLYVVYIPSLDISGYGKSLSKAEKIAQFNLDELSKYILELRSTEAIRSYLHTMGWAHKKMFNKQFSIPHEIIKNRLRDINAKEGSLKNITISSAA